MPKIKVEAKKTTKLDIDTNDLARALAENWEHYEIAQFLESLFDEIGWEGKESQVVEHLSLHGHRARLEAWSKGLPL